MTDCKVQVGESWALDLEIVDGHPEYLDFETQNNDQRAAIGVFMVKGTVPGNAGIGVDWEEWFTSDGDTTSITNQMQQQIQNYTDGDYLPIVYSDDSGSHVLTVRQ